MELLELKHKILDSFLGEKTELDKIIALVENDKSVFPFNEYEHLLQYFINSNNISFKQYLEIRQEYINQNPHLWVFEISAPRGFGEKFAN